MDNEPPPGGIHHRWPYPTKLTISLLLLALVLFLLARFSVVIPPFILAVILAYILNPIVNLFEHRLHLHRILAILLSYVLLLIVMATLPAVIIPILGSQFSEFNLDIQLVIQNLRDLLGHEYMIAGFRLDAAALFEQVILALQGLIEPIVGQTLELAVGVISSIVWIIFILVVAFYLIRDGAKLRQWFEDHIPPAYLQDFIYLRDRINEIWGAFFRGQLLLALVVAIIFTIIGFILGLPFALAMGVLAGLLEFLPSIGHGIWLVIAALVAFFLGSTWTWIPLPNWAFMLLVIGLHLFYQQFDLNYLIPRIIGRSVHLPPLVVILGIVAGAVLAGIMGIPLAAPTIASARVLGRYLFANLVDMPPFPEVVAPPLPPPNPRWWKRPASSNLPPRAPTP
jgi:predicted PurR-regulated permease PerM